MPRGYTAFLTASVCHQRVHHVRLVHFRDNISPSADIPARQKREGRDKRQCCELLPSFNSVVGMARKLRAAAQAANQSMSAWLSPFRHPTR